MANVVYNNTQNGLIEGAVAALGGQSVEVTTTPGQTPPSVTINSALVLGTLNITADSGATALVNVIASVGGTLTLVADGGTIDASSAIGALSGTDVTIADGGVFIAESSFLGLLNNTTMTFGADTGFTDTLVLNNGGGLLNLSSTSAFANFMDGGKDVIDDRLIVGANVVSYAITQASSTSSQILTYLDANSASLGTLTFVAGTFTAAQLGTYAVNDASGPLQMSVGAAGGIVTATHGSSYTGGGDSTMVASGLVTTIKNTGANWTSVGGSNGAIYVANALASVTGSGHTVYLDGSSGNGASLWNTNGVWDNVIGSNGSVFLNNAISGVVGGANTITFSYGSGNVASLWNTADKWDNVIGSNGTVALNNAISGIVGGGNTVTFASGAGNVASLWNTNGVLDSVIGSNGQVLLNNAASTVNGGGNTINFAFGSGNAASLLNTNGVWDNVVGSNGVVNLSNAISGIVGGGDAVNFVGGSGNGASLWNTDGVADTITGSNGAVYLNNAQAIVNGIGNTIVFANPGANSVTASGTSDAFVFQLLSGQNSLTGFDGATDQLYMSASQFGSNFQAFLANDVSQGGGDTIITDPGNHANQMTLTGIASSSLSQANTHFV